MTYEIHRDYIHFGNARSGYHLKEVLFIVSHDTGNPGSTAQENRDYFNTHQPSASAHTFIDDKTILEIIPLNEKAWHVRYEVAGDNKQFGANANDCAIGVELAWGGTINFNEAYKRYVWYHAYLCKQFHLSPTKDIVAHSTLDPTRRSDPQFALQHYGRSWAQFLHDVSECLLADPNPSSAKDMPHLNHAVSLGDHGDQVKTIQHLLLQHGLSLHQFGEDGVFGDETEKAVREFQKSHPPLKVDGIVGPLTLKRLRA